MNKLLKKILIIIGCVIAAIILLILLGFLYIYIAEYRPKDIEPSELHNVSDKVMSLDTEMRIFSWNIGYCALGDNASFFMDGGEDVYTSDKPRVLANLADIIARIDESQPDFISLQEVDKNSSRSYGIDQAKMIGQHFSDFDWSYVYNFNVNFCPFPMPPHAPIGRVKSGLQTLSKYHIVQSNRVSLPVPFKGLVRSCNLKRALDVNYFDIQDSDKQFVLIDLHLEAFDHGEGKIAQTKKLRSVLDSEVAKGNYVIAIGDYNQTMSTKVGVYPQVEKLWHPGVLNVEDFTEYNIYMDDTYPTCRSNASRYVGADKATFQYYLIDGAIVSKNVEVISFNVINYDFKSSDHNPTLLKFKLTK